MCNCCHKVEGNLKFKQCNGCKAVRYCSGRCQKAHWKTHKKICQVIQELSKLNKQQDIGQGDGEDPNVFVSHINPKQHARITRLVGKQCTVVSELNNKQFKMLWDTGAHVSVISGHDMSQYFPDTSIRKIEDFLGTETKINLVAANGTEIPHKEWAELDFRIPDNQSSINVIEVPFLATAELIDMPIIGFDVIEQIVSNDSADNLDFESCFSKMFVNAKPKNAEAFISLIRTITTENKSGECKNLQNGFCYSKEQNC